MPNPNSGGPSNAILLDGKLSASHIEAMLAQTISAFSRPPCIALVRVGNDFASGVYVKRKIVACTRVGIRSVVHELTTVTEADLIGLIGALNADQDIDGILVQLPLPPGIDPHKVILAIKPDKDIDGFHPDNLGQLMAGRPRLTAATPAGILHLLRMYDIPLGGMHAVILGRSLIVGKPLAALLTSAHVTVTLCHSRTRALPEIIRQADLVVAAVGSPWLVTPSQVKPGAVVIDVGINRDAEGKIVGDVHPEVEHVAGWLSPVPGGVGPMTIAALLCNTVRAFLLNTGQPTLRNEGAKLLGSLYADLL